MVRITEDLIRKRAEHNQCEIFSLEELSLHQQDLEKIEHIEKWCRDLKILYFQNNLIGKIENVGRLKKLEYLNLALNNVERVENLQGCESLKKLDLTVNFVGELTSIESLRKNIFLEEIFLTGNPCTKYEGYKEYVYATLPQLRYLDGHEIEKSERIQAMQDLPALREGILEQEYMYKLEREEQKKEAVPKIQELDCSDEEDEKAKDQEFWKEKVDYTPESRISIQNKLKENREKKTKSKFEQPKEKRTRRLFNEEGKPMNVNESKVDFSLTESDDDTALVLDVTCYKYMDTSLIDADVQPWYVRVTMKGSVLQLALLDEVRPDASVAKRSQITGHLIITMPKLYPGSNPSFISTAKEKMKEKQSPKPQTYREKLEVRTRKTFEENLASIVDNPKQEQKTNFNPKPTKLPPKNSPNFVDNPDVPPLI